LFCFDFEDIDIVLETVLVSHCNEAIGIIHQRTCDVFIHLEKNKKIKKRTHLYWVWKALAFHRSLFVPRDGQAKKRKEKKNENECKNSSAVWK